MKHERENRATNSEFDPASFLMAIMWLCTFFAVCALGIGIGMKALRWGLGL